LLIIKLIIDSLIADNIDVKEFIVISIVCIKADKVEVTRFRMDIMEDIMLIIVFIINININNIPSSRFLYHYFTTTYAITALMDDMYRTRVCIQPSL
jgi:hypothetical protein